MQSKALKGALAPIVALCAAPLAMGQQAQDASSQSDAEELGEVVVSGYRASLRLQVNNLPNEPLRITRDNTLDRLGSYDVYGRRAMLDFTFKY